MGQIAVWDKIIKNADSPAYTGRKLTIGNIETKKDCAGIFILFLKFCIHFTTFLIPGRKKINIFFSLYRKSAFLYITYQGMGAK